MTKTSRDTSAASEAAFHKHYAAIWGEERWHKSLYPALVEQTRQVALVNQYASASSFEHCFEKREDRENLQQVVFPSSNAAKESSHLICYTTQDDALAEEGAEVKKQDRVSLPQPRLGETDRLMSHWNLDAASVLAVHLLDVQPSDHVLDLCAAPGGKSIALAQSIWPYLHTTSPTTEPLEKAGYLRSNESDRPRYKRLTQNLTSYLPPQLWTAGFAATTNMDATELAASRTLLLTTAGYDKVLVDAPCSSERHIIHAHHAARMAGRTAPEMANWRPGSSKRLTKIQVELLGTALRCAKIGGKVLYATCSIEPAENDGVVERCLQQLAKEGKKGLKWTVKHELKGCESEGTLEGKLQSKWAERTQYGWIVLPDNPVEGRWGPLYFAVLTKTDREG